MLSTCIQSPVGALSIFENDGAIVRLAWGAAPVSRSCVLDNAAQQLAAYCGGELHGFNLPLHVAGSDFQQSVCAEMTKIPFGETVTYGDLAKTLGCAAQPIGRACGLNPIPIIIPCHRVMGAGGKLVGFSGQGGVDTKVALLRHEGAAGLLI